MQKTIETTPQVTLTAQDVESFPSELTHYATIYKDLFRRPEQQAHCETYLKGLLLDLPNKSIETMMLNLNGDDPNAIRNMQHFISEGSWQDSLILERHWSEVNEDLGDKNGVLIGDDSGFPKQGQKSVGVKRQWCGQLGKRANCQVGVFLGYASPQGRTLLNHRLYMPQEWLEEEAYAAQRQKCGVPAEVTFKTKPALLLEMVQEVHQAGTLPFRWLTVDEAFGRDTFFLDQVGEMLWYFAEVPINTRIWRTRPQTEVPAWSGQGRKPTRLQLVANESAAQEVHQIAASLPEEAWIRQAIKEGSQGTIEADFVTLRVVTVRDALPGPDVWLVLRRHPETKEVKYYLSNAPAETMLATFAWLSGMRWPIETCFEEGKQELGLGDYQVRSWKGWQHHMTLCILAHFFLVRLQIKFKEDAPQLTLPQAVVLLKAAFAEPELDTAKALEIVNYYQRRHYAAYISHRKRRLAATTTSKVSL